MDFGKQFENFFGFDPSSSKVHTTKKEKVQLPPKDFDPEMELLEEDIEPVCN